MSWSLIVDLMVQPQRIMLNTWDALTPMSFQGERRGRIWPPAGGVLRRAEETEMELRSLMSVPLPPSSDPPTLPSRRVRILPA
ncbi:hypothetical protein VTK26DRAFT_4167 [Humicola hyalothermophila]